jgi:hypothetical protein
MKSVRSFSFAVALTLGAFGQFAGVAHAQSPVQGRFNLPYAVKWENAAVPAGDYEFYLRSAGASELLTLQKIGGNSCEFVVMARASEPIRAGDPNKLTFVIRDGKRFVSSMQLPEFGMNLAFLVQDKPPGRQVAQADLISLSPPEK